MCHVASFHYRLNSAIGSSHPNIFRLITISKKKEFNSWLKFERVLLGYKVKENKAASDKMQQTSVFVRLFKMKNKSTPIVNV